ncbi:Transposase [Popillia japonica]|uniref:Transposase n=1 Tax=Popillia japonica TaxID=7064 RepID=A0AAW1JBJ3_POPJA
MGRGRDVSEEKNYLCPITYTDHAYAILQTGNYSVRKIASMQSVSHPVVVRLAQQLKKQSVSHPVVVRLAQQLKKIKKKSVREVRKDIQTDRIRISQRILERRLAESGFKSVRPTKKPLLTKKMKVARLEFAREYANFTLEDWKRKRFCCGWPSANVGSATPYFLKVAWR